MTLINTKKSTKKALLFQFSIFGKLGVSMVSVAVCGPRGREYDSQLDAALQLPSAEYMRVRINKIHR